MTARGDFGDSSASKLGIIGRGEGFERFSNVEQVVRNAGALFSRRFRGADVKAAINGDGIAIDDLAMEFFGECKGKGSLATRSRAEDDDEWVGHQRHPQYMDLPARTRMRMRMRIAI